MHVHDEHFASDTDDEVWLRASGERGWVVLSKDAAIRTNALEREALLASNVAFFSLGRGDLTAEHMGQVFVGALPQIRRALRRFQVPLIASVTIAHAVRVLYANGRKLSTVIDLRPTRRSN